jgi:starch synthase
MRVLSVASECVPFVKTGGLADVVGALPLAMGGQGVDMRVLLPGYPQVMAALGKTREVMEDKTLFGGPGRVLSGRAKGIDLLVLEADHLFGREGTPYLGPDGEDWDDNPERFAALSWIAARIAAEGTANGKPGGWHPDIAHGHDWQAGFMPYYLKKRGVAVPCIFTIHNIAFHGSAPAGRLARCASTGPISCRMAGSSSGAIDALKAGLVWSDRITTVSPTYARELTRPEFGAGLDGVVRSRAGQISGILNGIDTQVWNPAKDKALSAALPHAARQGEEPQGAEGGIRPARGARPDLRRGLAPDAAEGAGPASRCALRPFWKKAGSSCCSARASL